MDVQKATLNLSESNKIWLKNFFSCIDEMNSEAFGRFFADSSQFVFANFPAATGSTEIAGIAQSVFARLKKIEHALLSSWEAEDHLFVEGRVKYFLKDSDKTLEVPFFSLFEFENLAEKKIRSYRVFIDSSELMS